MLFSPHLQPTIILFTDLDWGGGVKIPSRILLPSISVQLDGVRILGRNKILRQLSFIKEL